jgi:uncharacterized protein YjbI with pentapeptide repeats
MPKRWAWLIGVVAVVLALAIVWTLLVPGADWLARHDVSSAKGSLATARDAARGRLLTLGAGLLAAGALVFTARNFTLSREGQVTDRYTKAIEQLGHEKIDVRIGGIYALERIARDSAKDHPTVMEVLTAFVREHSREPGPPPDSGSLEQRGLTRPDVQAAVAVVRRRHAKRDIQPIDLSDADLTRANLRVANLRGANLAGADLTGADLTRADLTGADLTHATLDGVRFTFAYLTRVNFTGTNLAGVNFAAYDLTRANFTDAHLDGARLHSTNLTHTIFAGADLAGADLAHANLAGVNLAGVNLAGADLAGADLAGADLTRADLAGVRWPTAEPVPEGWIVDSDSGGLKRRPAISLSTGQLSEVMAHYL